jgi:hypothetical protein
MGTSPRTTPRRRRRAPSPAECGRARGGQHEVQDRGYVTLAESCGARYRAGWTFEDCEGGTKVIFDFESTPVTLMAKLTSPILGLFFGRMMKRCLTDDFDDLQKSLESPQIG